MVILVHCQDFHESHMLLTSSDKGGQPVSCCSKNYFKRLPHELKSSGCLPIDIPSNDPFYADKHQRCMEFVRAQSVLRNDCKLGADEKVV